MEATVNGARLFYLAVGMEDKYPLFVLHGGPGLDHTEMTPWLDALSDDFRLIYVDLRGNGRSERVDPSTLSLSVFAADVTGLAAALGLPRYAVLGHSFGSFVTLAHAIEQGGASHYIISGGTASFAKSGQEIRENLATFEPVALRQQVTERWALEPHAKTQADKAAAWAAFQSALAGPRTTYANSIATAWQTYAAAVKAAQDAFNAAVTPTPSPSPSV